MITCSDCLSALSTSRLSDIRPGSPVATHYAGCERCRVIVHDLQYAERGLAAALDQFGPRTAPDEIVERAADSTFRRRRRIARVFRAALAIAGLFIFAAAMEALFENDQPPPPATSEAVVAPPAEQAAPPEQAAPAEPGVATEPTYK